MGPRDRTGTGTEEPEVEMQVVAMEEDNVGWKSALLEAQRKAIWTEMLPAPPQMAMAMAFVRVMMRIRTDGDPIPLQIV